MFKNKNILVLKKKKHSSYYDMLLRGIIEYGKPKNVYYVMYDSQRPLFRILIMRLKEIIDN